MKSVRTIRDRMGLSQQQLAQALGIPQTTLSMYERGTQLPADLAPLLIEVAKVHRLLIDCNHIYGGVELPPPVVLPPPRQLKPGEPATQAGG